MPLLEGKLKALVMIDPGLPVPQPTESHWQNPPHRLADIQSPSLPSTVDVVVIGSGITGTSVAWHLLKCDPHIRVAILEARSLCSGATGRNGGHLISYGGISYADTKNAVGPEMASKILQFVFETIVQVKKIALEHAATESQLRDVTRVRTFGDEDSFKAAKRSVAEFEKDYPEYEGLYKFISRDGALVSMPTKIIILHKMPTRPETRMLWSSGRSGVSCCSSLALSICPETVGAYAKC